MHITFWLIIKIALIIAVTPLLGGLIGTALAARERTNPPGDGGQTKNKPLSTRRLMRELGKRSRRNAA